MTTPDFPPEFLDALDAAVMARGGKPERDEIRFRCPSPDHDDVHPSARWSRAKVGWICDACGTGGGALKLAKLLGVERPRRRGGRAAPPPNALEHSNTSSALTLAEYAAAKRLPEGFLRRLGLSDYRHQRGPSVRIPYRKADGTEAAARYRHALSGEDRFSWKAGSKTCLYGLDRLADARAAGYVFLLEGESDTQTCWYAGIPATGLPGAANWNDARDAGHLDGIDAIYVPIEPDQGGEAVLRWLETSSVRDRVRLVDLSGFGVKDVSALYLQDPDGFAEAMDLARADAVPWADRLAGERGGEAAAALASARDLLEADDLFDRVALAIAGRGYAGDPRPAVTGYVSLSSRFLERPLNLAFVAQSGAGKNRAVDAARDLVPPEAVHLVVAGSARALVYTDASFEHRVVVFAEADSIPEDGPAATAVRTLATDNRMEYEVVERDEQTGRFVTRKIVKPGPTGLVTTSTKSLGEQMGTRVLEVPIPDDPEQTRRVLEAHAAAVMPGTTTDVDLGPFHAAQRWLELAGERRVAVPFAHVLSGLVPWDAVRMRRDFRQLLTCIQSIAFLHQRQRGRTPDGWVVAEIRDYALARDLLAPIFDTVAAEGVTPAIRETVEAIGESEELSAVALGTRLGLSKSTVSWRTKRAVAGGWLVNAEERRGRSARYARGAPLPEETTALPPPGRVRELFECSNGFRDEGAPSPLPHSVPEEGDGPSSPNGVEHPDGHRNGTGCTLCGEPMPPGGGVLCATCRQLVDEVNPATGSVEQEGAEANLKDSVAPAVQAAFAVEVF